MKPNITWFLIADGARAHIVVNEGPGKGVKRANGSYEYAMPNAPTREWISDKPGRSSGGDGQRHAVDYRSDYHQVAKQKFAREMAEVIDGAARDKAFDRLVLVAPPKILGELRSALGSEARGRIYAEMDKNLTHVELKDLPAHLGEVAPV